MKARTSLILSTLGLSLALGLGVFSLAGRAATSVAAPAVIVPFGSPATIDGSFDGAASVHAADFDLDGDLDVLAAATTSGVSWWQNNGSGGGWGETNVRSAGANDACAADVDGDNAPDILLASSGSNTISVIENNGLLWNSTSDLGFSGAAVVHAVDMDGDGLMDILGAGVADGIAWWKNEGGSHASWSARQTIDTTFQDGTVSAADLDGDSDLDVISARAWGAGPYLVWWENDGSGGGWTRRTIGGSPDHMKKVHAADVDGDGDMDVIGATDFVYNHVYWFRNDGTPKDGGWAKFNIDLGFLAEELFSADLDGDGDTDVLGASTSADWIVWWENNGSGGGWTRRTVGSGFDGAAGVFAADLDGDRDPDVLGAASVADDVTWWESLVNHPEVTGVVPQRNDIAVPLSPLVSVSYDQPIQAASVTSQTFVLHGMQSGMMTGTHSADGNTVTITPNRPFRHGEQVYAIATMKMNNITGTAPVLPTQFQFNTGTDRGCCFSGFVEVETGLLDVADGAAAWGDYDGDGDLDIWLAGYGNGIRPTRPYRNDGPAPPSGWTFTDLGGGWDFADATAVAWGDYDNDGDLDALLAGTGGTRVARNDGYDFFADSGVHLPLWNSERGDTAAWGDYDNDGYLDILVAAEDASGYPVTRVYRNNGNGTFSNSFAGLPGVGEGSVAWGDYDSDGYLDILLAGITPFGSGFTFISRVYRNNGDGSFSDINAGLPGVCSGSATWGDYDNDGDLDILLAGCTYTDLPGFCLGSVISQVYRNNGDDTFSDIGAGLPGVWQASVAGGDYDNDGDLDILIAGCADEDCSTPISRVYRNDEGWAFNDINAGLTGLRSSSAAWGDYDGDGDLDILLTGYSTNVQSSKRTLLYRNNDHKAYLPFISK